MMGGSAATTCKLEYNINITTMKQILSLWDACPQGGKHRRSVFLRLLLLVCMLATASAGWANQTGLITNITLPDIPSGTLDMTTQTDFTADSNGWIVFAPAYGSTVSGKNWWSSNSSNSSSSSYTPPSGTTAPFKTTAQIGGGNYFNLRRTYTYAIRFTGAESISILAKSGGSSRSAHIALYSYDGENQIPVEDKGSNTNSENEIIHPSLSTSTTYIAYFYGSDTSSSNLYQIAIKKATSSAPTLVGASSSPAASATNVAVSGTGFLKFSKNLSSVTAANITISPNSNGEALSSIAIDGTDASKVNYTWSGLQKNTEYTINVAANAVSAGTDGNTATSLSFTTVAKTALTGAWSNANPTFENGAASPTIPTFSVTGGGTAGTDYTVAYTLVSGSNVNVNSSTGITNIDTNTAGTSVVRATVTLNNTADYSMVTTTYDCTITVNASSSSESSTFTTGNLGYSFFGGSSTISGPQTKTKTITDSGHTFTLTATVPTGGTIGSSEIKASSSETASLQIQAPAGCTITSIVFTTSSNALTTYSVDDTNITNNGDKTYTWTGSSNNVTFNFYKNGSTTGLKSVAITYSAGNAYAITYAGSVTNGTINGTKSAAAAGTNITVTATPTNDDYEFDALIIKKTADNTDVTSACNVSGNVFEMPAYPVTVSGTFREKPTVEVSSSITGGSVTANPSGHVSAGTTVTLTVTPESGNTLDELTVLAGSTPITVTNNQFTMPNSNVTITATFTTAVVSDGDKWNFTTMSGADETRYIADDLWNTDNSSYYSNLFKAADNYSSSDIIQIQNLKFIRSGSSLSNDNIRIYKKTSTSDGYMLFNGGSNRGVVIPASELNTGDQITIDYNGGGSTSGFTISNAKEVGSETAVTSTTSATRTTFSFRVADGDQDVNLIANNSGVKLYRITLGTSAVVDVAEPAFDPADGTPYNGDAAGLSVNVTENQSIGDGTEVATYWKFDTKALPRTEIVNAGNTAATATITKANVNEHDVVLSAVTKYVIGGKTYYSDVVTATYPYAGTHTFKVLSANQTVNQGQRSVGPNKIVDNDGNLIGIMEDTEHPGTYIYYVLGEDDATPDYTEYFNFTYANTSTMSGDNAAKISINESGSIVTKDETTEAAVGSYRDMTVYATVKSAYASLFTNTTSATETFRVTIAEKVVAGDLGLTFWWDRDCTIPVVQGVDWQLGNGTDQSANTGVFGKPSYTDSSKGTPTHFTDGFPNGGVIYVKPDNANDQVWFSYKANGEPKDFDATKQSEGSGTWHYRRGIPIHLTDAITDGTSYVRVNVVPYIVDGSNWQKRAGVTKIVFYMKNNGLKSAGAGTRPDKPTYDPDPTTLSTAVTVAAIGGEGNAVYSKFSGDKSGKKTTYSAERLINEANVNAGIGQVAVFSTEVAKRWIAAIQVATETYAGRGGAAMDFISEADNVSTNYVYEFASRLTLSSNTYNTTVHKTGDDYETIDLRTLVSQLAFWKKNTSDKFTGEYVDLPAEEVAKITFTPTFYNGANVGGDGKQPSKVEGNIVTIGDHSGRIEIEVEYPGGYTYPSTVNGRTGNVSAATAKYTIFITDPNEQVPTIMPTSRNFTDQQAVIVQAPTEWNTLYAIEYADNNGNYPTETFKYNSSTDPKNCVLLKAGEYANITLTESARVRAFAYDQNVFTENHEPEQTGTNTSKEVMETYTKLPPLDPPVFDPYGTAENPHVRTDLKLSIAASTSEGGLVVYFTTDGSTPTTSSEQYDGNKKIVISGASTTVKAIAYDPEDGRISPVATGVYIYQGTLTKPVFHVTGMGAGDYSNGETVTVNSNSRITLTNTDNGEIYYTLDGSTPTTGEAKHFEGGDIIIVKNTTGKALAVKGDASSPITTVNFVLSDESENLWEAVDATTPDGTLPANDRYVVYGKEDGNASSMAVKYLTATFGGMDNAKWTNGNIGESTKGTPLDGVGSYNIVTGGDAWDETGAEVQNTPKTGGTLAQHEKTFKLPAQGDLVRFEPERDGRLTVWLLQQGGLHYDDDGNLCNRFIRLRPVYMFDEQGNSIAASETDGVRSAARLSNNWEELDYDESKDYGGGRHGNWTPKGGAQNGVTNKFFTEGESEAIYNMYKDYLTNAHKGEGDPIAPFAIPTESSVYTFMGTQGIIGTGYVMPSGGYVRYTFDVKGGKTYFLFGYRTKLGVRGFRFKPSEEEATEVTMADDKNNALNAFSSAGTNICNVTYNRQFEANTWAAIVLPFSVSRTQLQKVFGDGVDVLHLEKTTEHSMDLKRHWYPMIVAGTPVLIKPSQKVTEAKFYGVHYEASSVTNVVPSEGAYMMTGSFGQGNLVKGDYYVATNGSIKYLTSESATSKSCRSWFTPKPGQSARASLMMGATDAFAEEAWNVIGNPQPFVASDETVVTYINGVQEDGIINNIFDGPTGIYTINGQLIRKDATSLEGLSKGIYIVNGKKIAIK